MNYFFQQDESIELFEKVSESFLKVVSYFANHQTGIIYFGVSEDGDVVGIEDPSLQRSNIETMIKEHINPLPEYKISEHEISGKTVLELDVYKRLKIPYTYDNITYQKDGAFCIPCDEDSYQNLVKGIPFEKRPYFKQDLQFKTLEAYMQKEIGIEKMSLDILKTLGLYVDGRYNNAAALLADHHTLKSSGMDLICLDDTELITLDHMILENESLLKIYDTALIFFDKWYYTYEDNRVYIPRYAFIEALSYALCDQDYSKDEKMKVVFYHDHIEMTYPVELSDRIDEKEFMRGKTSLFPNETIAMIFHLLHLFETLRASIKSMQFEYEEFVEKPSFTICSNSITIVLPGVKTLSNTK